MNELTAQPSSSVEPDPIREALQRVRCRMRRAGDPDPMHLEFIEDDLREGKRGVEEIEAFFDDIVALLARPDARGADLVDLADDPAILDRLDYLVVVVSNLRRRLLHLASRGGAQ